MPRFFLFFAVFVLFSALTAGNVSATLPDTRGLRSATSPALGESSPALFSAPVDVDLFLGQYKRRRSSGGRVWGNVYYGDTTLKPKEEDKLHPSFYGIQLGIDVPKSHGIFSTYFLNINQSNMRFDGDSSTINNYLLGYGKFVYLSMCHFTLTGSMGYDQYNVDASKGNGLQMNFFGEFGLDFLFGKWGIKPFYALQYDFLYHGNIEDTSIGDWNGHGFNQLFGLRLSWKVTDWLELQSRTTWVYEMLDNPPPFYRVRFSPVHGINTPAILYYEGNTGRDWVWLGIGGKFEGVYNLYLFCDYDVLLNERHITHLGSVGLCLGW